MSIGSTNSREVPFTILEETPLPTAECAISSLILKKPYVFITSEKQLKFVSEGRHSKKVVDDLTVSNESEISLRDARMLDPLAEVGQSIQVKYSQSFEPKTYQLSCLCDYVARTLLSNEGRDNPYDPQRSPIFGIALSKRLGYQFNENPVDQTTGFQIVEEGPIERGTFDKDPKTQQLAKKIEGYLNNNDFISLSTLKRLVGRPQIPSDHPHTWVNLFKKYSPPLVMILGSLVTMITFFKSVFSKAHSIRVFQERQNGSPQKQRSPKDRTNGVYQTFDSPSIKGGIYT